MKLTIIIAINCFFVIVNFHNHFDKALTEIFQFRRALGGSFFGKCIQRHFIWHVSAADFLIPRGGRTDFYLSPPPRPPPENFALPWKKPRLRTPMATNVGKFQLDK